jgi:hypothetical protein
MVFLLKFMVLVNIFFNILNCFDVIILKYKKIILIYL